MQDGDEHFVQRNAQYRGFVRRTPGVGRMVDGVFTLSNMGDGKDREVIHFIVVARMVAIRAFRRHLSGLNISFQHNLRAGGHFQIVRDALNDFGFRAAQQPGKRILGEGIRNRGHRPENRRRIGAQRDGNRKTLAWMRCAPLLEVQRAAAMR